jgi:SAM-dependent methyltransferase
MLTNTSDCLLCFSKSPLLLHSRGSAFHKCGNCGAIFRDGADDLTPEQEKERYEAHNNHPDDPEYSSFVAPIVDEVEKLFTPNKSGLDFGARPVPVITTLLREKGYKIEPYDPFFHDQPELLKKQTYDYIACCEVIEHFGDPAREFKLLRSLLKPGGAMLCMTELYDESIIDFKKWRYKDDRTHKFFYTRSSLEWIRDNFDFASLEVNGRLVSLAAS